MGLSDAIQSAIGGRRYLLLTYRNYSRVVEPYVLGVVADGREVLCAYQVSGGDEAHAPVGWKSFEVRAIGGARILANGFSGERTPAPDAWSLVTIQCAVPAPPRSD